MIDYGQAPSSDQFEIAVFGPGFGEAVAVHLGLGQWILVDSCEEPVSKNPATAVYLDSIGVAPNAVQAVIASHWHDDHVRGIAKLVGRYPNAEFVISTVLTNKEARTFLAAYGGASAPSQARGINEIATAISLRDTVAFVHYRCNIIELDVAPNRTIRVTALSPVNDAVAQFIERIASYLPGPAGGTPINHAPELRPNHESVVVHVDLGDDAILLGSDLENRRRYGWDALLSDSWSGSRRRSRAYKVAHHGSQSGDSERIWTSFLENEPHAVMTPFNLGRVKLPSTDDRDRLRKKTPGAFITSGAGQRPEMAPRLARRLSKICKELSPVNSGFGAVRLRRKFSDLKWTFELFGAAQRL